MSRRNRNTRLRLESLEGRRLLATLTVTTTADSGAGSLREAIVVANASTGVPDDIVFNIPTSDAGFNLEGNAPGNQWWTIKLQSSLPAITDSGTQIFGSTQTSNVGDTNVGTLGSGGFVGVDNIPLPTYNRPEIAIDLNNAVPATTTLRKSINMTGTASDILIEGLAIHGDTGTGSGTDALINSNGTGTGRVVDGVIVGLLPDGSVPAIRQARFGIQTTGSAELTVQNSLVAENGRGGINGVASSSVLNIYGSEVFNNGWDSVDHDGIDLNGINGEVIGNLSYNNLTSDGAARPHAGNGIELGSQDAGTGGNVVRNNTSYGNVSSGVGIRKGASNNLVELNVLYDNAVGISVNDEGREPTAGNVLSRNSIFDNLPGVDENGLPMGGLGIDLTPFALNYNGVTLNDQNDADTGANLQANFPIIAEASISDGWLTVSGFARPDAQIELFIAAPDPTGFGEGKTFVASFVEGSVEDLDGGTGTYGPIFNGLTVSTGPVTTNTFKFRIPVVSGSLARARR